MVGNGAAMHGLRERCHRVAVSTPKTRPVARAVIPQAPAGIGSMTFEVEDIDMEPINRKATPIGIIDVQEEGAATSISVSPHQLACGIPVRAKTFEGCARVHPAIPAGTLNQWV